MMLRKYQTIKLDPWAGRSTTIIEKRSMPILVWLIDRWFLYAHEWMYWINKDWHRKIMHPFCYAYNFVADWAYGFERIDETTEYREC
jgi:hypothetical protein